MNVVLIFGVVLLLGLLLSEVANRTVLSTAVVFLLAGFVCGKSVLGWIAIDPNDAAVSHLAELALVAVLFTDGMKVGIRDLISAWRLPGRALVLGLPLTLGLTAVMCHYLVGLNWTKSLLIGAVLCPTDPVFAAAIVGRKNIPRQLRHLLNVESGVNDGLALPIVLALLAASGAGSIDLGTLALQLAGGIAIGIAAPWIATRLERTRWFSVSSDFGTLFALAIGIVVWATAVELHTNEYLAAFAAGVTVASVRSKLRDEFERFGFLLTELLKLSALLLFGALISLPFLMQAKWTDYAFAIAAIVLARPLALLPALWGTGMSVREKVVASWFGPKGFASVVYGIMVLKSDLPDRGQLFHLIALVIAISIIAHSSSDVPIARWFPRELEKSN